LAKNKQFVKKNCEKPAGQAERGVDLQGYQKSF
jgi:hypothetical protein